MVKRYFALLITSAIFTWVAVVLSVTARTYVATTDAMPRYDLATHSYFGWELYHYLTTFNLPMFLWSIWEESRWPFVNAIIQSPFYLALGEEYKSSIPAAAFTLAGIGIVSSAIIAGRSKAPMVTIAIVALLILSSPIYLAFSSFTMMEITGSFAQALCLLTYLLSRETKAPLYSKLFGFSLLLIFFTKFNYFAMTAISLAVVEYHLQTVGKSLGDHLSMWRRWFLAVWSRPVGKFFIVYSFVVAILTKIGMIRFEILGQEITINGVGSSGYFILYLFLWILWKTHREDKINWANIFSVDHRVEPLIYYYVIPTLVWFAIPYPNHMNDFFTYLFTHKNPVGMTFGEGAIYYFVAMRDHYFFNIYLMLSTLAFFLLAVIRFAKQPVFMKLLLATATLELLMAFTHHLKESRFLFSAMLPFWIASSSEFGYWLSKLLKKNASQHLLAFAIIIASVLMFHSTMKSDAFIDLSRWQYHENSVYSKGFSWIKNHLQKDSRLAVLGKADWLSPQLFEWKLGKPAGYSDFIGKVEPEEHGWLTEATHMLLIAPTGTPSNPEIVAQYDIHKRKVDELVATNSFALIEKFDIKNENLSFWLYKQKSR